MSFKRALVTGASGLVGGHLIDRLLSDGVEVVALVRDWEPTSMLVVDGGISRVSIVRGDLTDLALLQRVIGEYEVDVVFHLAAQTIVSIANRNPWSSWESNIRGTYSLMEAARLSPRLRRVVVASTDKVYGESTVLPTPETAPLAAQYPYETSKACADMICRSYHATFGTPVVLTRCGNLFGEGDLNWNRLVPGTVRSCLRDEEPVIRSDGRMVRDYLYVGDVVDAYVTLASDGVVGEAYNISDGNVMNVEEMTRLTMAACGRDRGAPVMILGQPTQEIPVQYIDSTKIRALGWKATYGIDAGLERTVEWYRNLERNCQ